jgi:CheY-like chemotaxis protein
LSVIDTWQGFFTSKKNLFLNMSLRILYVDDDPEDAEIFCEALAEIDPDIQCKIATNARTAIALFSPPCPEFIFLDFRMPIVSGVDLLKEIKSRECFSNTTIVMFSTHMDSRAVEQCKNLGAEHCISKQGDFNDLLISLRQIFGKEKKSLAVC